MNETDADADDGSLLDNLPEDVDSVKDATSDPREWTQQQTIGVAVGVAVALILLLLACYCCRRRGGGCCGGGPKQQPYQLQRPYVTRSAGSTVTSKKLPQGAILHGAEKLQLAKLDGSGVRVAVIDSGIDKDHPGFDGRVMKQEWYRAGTPLSEDDHGNSFSCLLRLLLNCSLAQTNLFYSYHLIIDRNTRCRHNPLHGTTS